MHRSSGPPPWFVFLTSVALVLGLYYLWLGGRDYIRTGGLGIQEATAQAVEISTATAVRRATDAIPTWTLIPSFTPVPPCIPWRVTVGSANVRMQPNTNAPVLDVFNEGQTVCVIQQADQSEWYQIDLNPDTRRVDEAYMHQDVMFPQNPTETPTQTVTPLPTVTPITPTQTPTLTETPTLDPDAPTITAPPTARPTRTPRPTETIPPPVRSAALPLDRSLPGAGESG